MQGLSYEELTKCRIGGYEPPLLHRPPWMQMGFPPFTINTVEYMRRDYQIRIGMAIKIACILKAKFTVSGAPGPKEACEQLLRKLWLHLIPHAVSAQFYTQSAAEMVYTEKRNRFEFDYCRPIYPSDYRIFTQNGVKHSIRVKVRHQTNQQTSGPITLHGPKSFLYVHRREFGSWNGISELEGAYPSWFDKMDRQGAMAIRRLWFFKNAFDSGFILCPPGVYNSANGEKIPYRDLARQALESSMVGATWVFDNITDGEGRPLWHFEKPQINGNADGMLNYVNQLDTEILRGLEIPDDVISQVSGTGSFAGRTIPLTAFFIGQNQQLFWLVNELKEQIIAPVMRMNFGKDADYEIESAEVNTDALMPQGPGEGGESAEETENPQGAAASAAQIAAAQQKQQQEQLSHLTAMLEKMTAEKSIPVANVEINGERAALVDLSKPKRESTSVYQFSGNVAGNDFFADQIATKTGVSPDLAKALLLLGESAHGEPQNVAGLMQNLLSNSLHRDAAQHAIAFVAQSSGDPTLIRAFDDRGRLQYNAVQSSGDPSLLYRLSQGNGEGAEEPEPEFMLS